MGVPFSSNSSESRAAVLGVPFDCGTHPTRIGARLGPAAIREQSALVRPYQPPAWDFDPLAQLNVVDCGDVSCTSGVITPSLDNIEQAVAKIVSAGAVPVTMGGDGLVTLPQLRALHQRYSDLVVLHIDAHTDTYPGDGESEHQRYNTATTFTRAAEEGLIDTQRSFHIGARGTVTVPGAFEHTREAREGLQLLAGLQGLKLVAIDVNTVSPPHDVGGMTAFLAATVMIQCLALLCDNSTDF